MSDNSWATTNTAASAAAELEAFSAATTASTSTTTSMALSSTLSSVTETIKSLISDTTTAATAAALPSTTAAAASSTIATTSFSATSDMITSTTTKAAAATFDDAAAAAAAEATTMANKLNVADLSSSLQHFGIVDYCVFVLMLVICAAIGFYFGFIDKTQKKRGVEQRRGSEALDYLVGGRKMKVIPVSLSLVASFVSGISLLGTSTEIYVYGTQYAFILITLAISGVISWYVFLPVFCNLQLTSTYEYFEMRFDKNVRLLGSVLFTIGTVIWLPIVIYVPALAFNQVTGINIHIITPVVCVVCIFYTCVGGLKAVVWTDVIQTVVMLGAVIFVIIKGTINVGGLGVVWERNLASGRIEMPTWTWDPTVRISMLSVFVGSTLFLVQSTACDQVIIQRYLSVPSLKEAKNCLIIFTCGVILLTAATFYNGLLIFATYHDCDPLSTKLAKAKDQLVPLLVMDTLSMYPGIPGVFVVGVFSAALSSLSTGLNSLAAVILEDFIKPFYKTPLSEHQTAVIMRTSVVLIGVLSAGLVFVVEHMRTHVVQLSVTLGSVTIGPLLGLFLLGLLLPWINGKCALAGCITACFLMSIVCINAQMGIASGELYFTPKSVSTEGCTYAFEAVTNLANSTAPPLQDSRTFFQYIYHMSFLLYAAVGCALTMITASIATLVFGYNDPSQMNIELFSPFVQRLLKPVEYVSVLEAEEVPLNEKKSDKKLSFSL